MTSNPDQPQLPVGLIALLSGCNFVIGMGAFVVIGMVPLLAADLDASTAAAGGTMTAYALAYAVLSPLLVSLTGRVGRRRVLAAGMAIFALAALLSAVATNLTLLYAARALAAAGAGVVTPVGAAVVAALAPKSTQGKSIAAFYFGLTFAQVLGVPVGSWVSFTFGWRAAFWIVVVLALAATVLIWVRVPAGLRFKPVSLADLGQALKNGLVMGAVLFTASFLGAIYVLYTYLAPLLEETMGYGRDGITLVLLVFGAGAVVGNLMGGWLTDRLGSVKSLVILCLAQILLMPAFSGLPMAPWVLLALVFAWSVMGWSFMAPQQVRLLNLAPSIAAVVLALNAAAIYIGTAVGSALGGAVQSAAGITWLGAAAGCAALGALVHILASHRAANLRAARA
ncbi:MFS transporter [Marivita hallyeonensis]|uniref:MFS transporter, DHA1 family, inner membrane transport protein n=1 Tax=Marivita hallyeonensis TaxID=996342 RepID=A0A1M5TQ12_9RHOB|nr:MFS transporter [Marivita hallyeonensis]SHH52804.1 MFS transporter, DHA1 family, inner membrane transport protein [Marivita hallyeonensis]